MTFIIIGVPPASDSSATVSADTIDSYLHAPTRVLSAYFVVVSKPLRSRFFFFFYYLLPLSGRRRLVFFVKVVVRVQRRETATRARHQSLYGSLTERVHVQDRPQGCQHFPQSADEIGPGNDRRARARGGGTAAASGGHDGSLQRPAVSCKRQKGLRRGFEVVSIRFLCARDSERGFEGKKTVATRVSYVYTSDEQ